MCLRIGPRCHVSCSSLTLLNGSQIAWVDNIRYLGVYLKCFRYFSCCFDHAKRSFFRSCNAIFGKIGRSASEDTVLHLLKLKCLPCLLYALEACPVNRTDVQSLEFTVTRVLMKIFKTNSKDIVIECKRYFGFRDVDELITYKRKRAFLAAFNVNDNSICNVCKHAADRIIAVS